jgi:hypothetical protein
VSDHIPHPYKTTGKIDVHVTLTSQITITNIAKKR